MNDPTLAFIFLFWHATLKEIRNVDTLISVVHTFLTSLNLFTQLFLQGETDRERAESTAAERSRERVTEGERMKRGFEAKRTEGEGDLGAEEGKKEEDWGQRRGNERQGAFPHQIRSDRPNWGLCASGGRFRMRWWNFLNSSFEKAEFKVCVYVTTPNRLKSASIHHLWVS